MSTLLRRPTVAACTLFGAATVIIAGMMPAHALRSCTNSEMRRISDSWIIDCFSHTGARLKCQANGDPVCCFNTAWGYKCTTSPAYVAPGRLDPGSGPVRPPRAGNPGTPPDRVGPYTPVPPRMGGNPDRVAPPSRPVRPPRIDPPPGKIGPSGPSGPTIRSGGRGK